MKSQEAIINYRKTKKGILTNIYNKQKERSRNKGWVNPEYDLKYIHDRYMELPLFDSLYRAWIASGCLKNLKPSIDRIDCLVHYTKDNIQMMTWGQNRFKQRTEMSIIRARKVYMNDGLFNINVFNSVSHAVRSTGLNQSGISMCLNNKRKTCGGYMWSYSKEIIGNIHEEQS